MAKKKENGRSSELRKVEIVADGVQLSISEDKNVFSLQFLNFDMYMHMYVCSQHAGFIHSSSRRKAAYGYPTT